MKKGLLILVGIALLVAGSAAYGVTTTTATINLYGSFNQIAAPIVPLYPDPRDFDNGPIKDWLIEGDGLFGADQLSWIDPTSASIVSFPNDWDYFPNFLMGDGYMAVCAGEQSSLTHSLTYTGVDISDTDAWISLPGQTGANGGFHYVGIPYPIGTQVLFYDVIVTDGAESHTMGELLETGSDWIGLSFLGLDAASQSTIPVPENSDYLEGGQMYIVQTLKSNIALILPHP